MAFNDIQRKKIENTLTAYLEKERPPPHIRPDLDLTFTIENQSVELCEIRPNWRDPSIKMVRPYAKATWVNAQKVWKVYWQRADLKWHAYQPEHTVRTIEAFLAIVSADEHACFHG